jgi:hypothetical protein
MIGQLFGEAFIDWNFLWFANVVYFLFTFDILGKCSSMTECVFGSAGSLGGFRKRLEDSYG